MKILSYNILADRYTNPERTKGHMNENHLDFAKRSARIMSEIRDSDADLICLQEVDHLADVYGPFLKDMGYEFHTEWRRVDNDAVLLGYKSDQFNLDQVEGFQHNEMVDKIGSNLFKKNNAGLMAKLTHRASRKQFIISTTHLNWNPKLDFVKYA